MLTKRQFLLSIAALSVSSALQAAGGPSGPAVHFQAQGKIGEVFVNPYRIAPLTAIIGNGGYELKDVSVRVVPKKGGHDALGGPERLPAASGPLSVGGAGLHS